MNGFELLLSVHHRQNDDSSWDLVVDQELGRGKFAWIFVVR